MEKLHKYMKQINQWTIINDGYPSVPIGRSRLGEKRRMRRGKRKGVDSKDTKDVSRIAS